MKRLAAALLASTALALQPASGQTVADSAKAAIGTSGLGIYPFGGANGLGYFDGTSAKPRSVPIAEIELQHAFANSFAFNGGLSATKLLVAVPDQYPQSCISAGGNPSGQKGICELLDGSGNLAFYATDDGGNPVSLMFQIGARGIYGVTMPTMDASRYLASTTNVDAKLNLRGINIESLGAVSGTNVNAALAAAATTCANSGRPIYVPSGAWLVTATTLLSVSCPGFYGDGFDSQFVLNNLNGAVFQYKLSPGQQLQNFVFRDVSVAGSWTNSTPSNIAANTLYSALLLLNEPLTLGQTAQAGDGINYSIFKNLSGVGVHDVVQISTGTTPYQAIPGAPTSPYSLASWSAWNTFSDFNTRAGSGGVTPYSAVHFYQGGSTGNQFHNFKGATTEAAVRIEGPYAGWGDLLYDGSEYGGARFFSFGPCLGYRNALTMIGQNDAGAVNLIKQEACSDANYPYQPPISNVLFYGINGGSNPWADLMEGLTMSFIRDYGDSRWGAGGSVVDDHTGSGSSVTKKLWELDVFNQGGTEVSVTVEGRVAAQPQSSTGARELSGSGIINATFFCAYDDILGASSCTQTSTSRWMADGGTYGANMPTIAWSHARGGTTNIQFTTTYTSTQGGTVGSSARYNTTLRTFAEAKGGVFKLNRLIDNSY